MKSRELIAKLRELDPEGEIEVSHVWDVERLPAYYDGALQIIDEKGNCKVTTKGLKLCIITRTLTDVILDNSEAVIDISELEGTWVKKYQERIEDARTQSREIDRTFPEYKQD